MLELAQHPVVVLDQLFLDERGKVLRLRAKQAVTPRNERGRALDERQMCEELGLEGPSDSMGHGGSQCVSLEKSGW
jgi:hypothetical protein